MELGKKGVLINASWGAWYPQGTDRLIRSAIYHGWEHDILTFKNEPINEYFKPEQPYTIKAAALVEAIRRGYTHILWLDCSCWFVGNPTKLMNMIDGENGLFIKSGYNLAQTSADSDLDWASSSRDEASQLDEVWSCMFGVDVTSERGKAWVYKFLDGADRGVFGTSREHNGASSDPRFLHARQDQTAASWAYHYAGFNNLREPSELLEYTSEQTNPNAIILMRGM
ncbi:hypothetical protein UFOVP1615_20 [uncultured Caudovirales phage]|jgi:hypothetical protein|uniref:Uncharacterized protein n=1 Tax=uncultured Caudovirales phage TaxID=2100421 RepID=A0A6J5SWB6_9CAUD|nr:hypothetical protein UFOVP1615_20 [uncultured Caudovirales phage]